MNKVITINLSGSAYTLEEAGYNALHAYLESAAASLANDPDKTEILSDIESAIAEKCAATLTPRKNVITTEEIKQIVSDMGPVNGADEAPEQPGQQPVQKRLYRDPDDRYIAGVASGLGYYFNIDRTIIRLIFIAALFAGGSSILIYLILWIAVPEARTPSQKLEMRGTSVTLENMKEMLSEKFKSLKKDDAKNRLKTFFQEVADFFVRTLWPILSKIIGAALVIAAFVSGITVTAGSSILVFGRLPILSDIFGMIAPGAFYVTLGALYCLVIIPLFFIYSAGLALLRKFTIAPGTRFALWGIWIGAIFVLSFTVPEIFFTLRHVNIHTLESSNTLY
jgi:phage shock protein PspC (stress-responsive transcriptional regulator)